MAFEFNIACAFELPPNRVVRLDLTFDWCFCCVVADFIIELESTYRFFVLNRPKLLEKNAMAAKSCIL